MNKVLMFVLALSGLAAGQTKKSIDWTACKDFESQFDAQVRKFNAEHSSGPQVMITCMYSGDSNGKRLSEWHVSLTAQETVHLRELRFNSRAAFEAEGGYEKALLAAHRIRELKTSDPCYYFVGIKMDDYFITVDPNAVDPAATDCKPQLGNQVQETKKDGNKNAKQTK